VIDKFETPAKWDGASMAGSTKSMNGAPARRRRAFRRGLVVAVQALACFALLFASPLPEAQAQTQRTWRTDVPGGLWSGTGNWVGGSVPVSGQVAVFGGSGLTLSSTVATAATVGQLFFDNSGTTSIILSAASANLTLSAVSGTGIFVNSNSGPVSISSSGTVLLSAPQTWTNLSSSTLSVMSQGWIGLNNSTNLTLAGTGPMSLGSFFNSQGEANPATSLTVEGSSVYTFGARI